MKYKYVPSCDLITMNENDKNVNKQGCFFSNQNPFNFDDLKSL